VGHLVERKGFGWFIREVLPGLPKEYGYLVVGGYGNQSVGDEMLRYRRMAQEAGVADRAWVVGWVPQEVLRLAYCAADVLVAPNVSVAGDMEGFGMVVLEGGSCGLPAVAARLEGLEDAVEEGQNGFLVPPGDAAAFREAILACPKDARYRRQVREFTLQRFSWKDVAARYLAVFRELSLQAGAAG